MLTSGNTLGYTPIRNEIQPLYTPMNFVRKETANAFTQLYQRGPYITVIHDGDIRAQQRVVQPYFAILYVTKTPSQSNFKRGSETFGG